MTIFAPRFCYRIQPFVVGYPLQQRAKNDVFHNQSLFCPGNRNFWGDRSWPWQISTWLRLNGLTFSFQGRKVSGYHVQAKSAVNEKFSFWGWRRDKLSNSKSIVHNYLLGTIFQLSCAQQSTRFPLFCHQILDISAKPAIKHKDNSAIHLYFYFTLSLWLLHGYSMLMSNFNLTLKV